MPPSKPPTGNNGITFVLSSPGIEFKIPSRQPAPRGRVSPYKQACAAICKTWKGRKSESKKKLITEKREQVYDDELAGFLLHWQLLAFYNGKFPVRMGRMKEVFTAVGNRQERVSPSGMPGSFSNQSVKLTSLAVLR